MPDDKGYSTPVELLRANAMNKRLSAKTMHTDGERLLQRAAVMYKEADEWDRAADLLEAGLKKEQD